MEDPIAEVERLSRMVKNEVTCAVETLGKVKEVFDVTGEMDMVSGSYRREESLR